MTTLWEMHQWIDFYDKEWVDNLSFWWWWISVVRKTTQEWDDYNTALDIWEIWFDTEKNILKVWDWETLWNNL